MADPITPPPELMEQWMQLHSTKYDLVRQAAQWGADQELDACCDLMADAYVECPGDLRAARRPKPSSLKEQALAELEKVDMLWDTTEFGQETLGSLDTIRRALEALDD
jgi:hypothetical protein